MNAQVAQHLNIAESLIAEIQEWAHVLFVRFVSGRPRFVSKKVTTVKKNIGLTGYELPAGVSFSSIDDELEYLDSLSQSSESNEQVQQSIGEIAKYLPMGCNPSDANLMNYAYQVAEGELSAQEAANRLSNKKIIIKKK